MFFFLSKTINYLFMPMTIISLCLVMSLILRNQRWKKWLFRVGLGLLLFMSNDFISNEFMRLWEIPVTPYAQITKHYTYGILLSGATRPGVGPDDRVYIFSSADRINHSVQLYRLGIISKILISGGSGTLIESSGKEADELATLIRLMGVPDSAIVVENESRNTHESAVNVSKMLAGKVSPDDCLLITSAFHMRRSRACFRNENWACDTFSADLRSHYRKFSPDILIVPKIEALAAWQVLFKEWIGMTAYYLAGYI